MSSEREIKRGIRNLLRELGASMTAKGFNYAVEVIYAGVVNDTPIVKGSKLCAHWAPVFGDTYPGTDHALRFIKDTCLLKSGNTPKFIEVFGVMSDDYKLHLYDFLESIRIYISEEMEEELCRI